ncbi:unnamed protein product [Cladocopium goreaui]|uniref:Centrosomal protein of 162 kDa n=1 Tax=Cladocopium goreaui TaxID=2562237 RepID=A0A9P1CWX5_9DINO|nr:unnamed protein product [Cladocopium goreaui]
MRRIASLLRGKSPELVNVMQNQFTALAERINAGEKITVKFIQVTMLQRQCETDRRRLAQLEKKFEVWRTRRVQGIVIVELCPSGPIMTQSWTMSKQTKAKVDAEKPDGRVLLADLHTAVRLPPCRSVVPMNKNFGRERWAEVQGSVSGLLEETQALARRLDGLDERLWARTSGSEASKQRNRELEQQVQALEQQNRLAAAAAEDDNTATKLRRTEHSLEEAYDVLRRVSTLEDEVGMAGAVIIESSADCVRQRSAPHRDGYLEEALDAELRALQANLEDGLQQLRDEFTNGGQEGTDLHSNDVFEVVRKADVGLSALERKVTGQVEEPTYRPLWRAFESKWTEYSAGFGALDGFVAEIVEFNIQLQARNQERREFEAEVQALKHRLQQVQDSNDESCSELREVRGGASGWGQGRTGTQKYQDFVFTARQTLRQARAETAALSCRPDIQEDNSWMRSTEERLANYEQDLFDLRERLEELTQGDLDGKTVTIKPNEDVEDMRRRLDWLEEQGTSATDKPELGRLAQVQNTICDLVEQVSKLKQQASSAEANSSSWQQQVKQIHGLIERKQNEDAASLRVTSEVEAKVGALSSQVADLAARLLEVEGNLDFVRENEPSSLTEAPRMTLSTPLPSEGAPQPSALQEKLEAIAAHLEIVDDLTDRVGDLERRWSLSAGQEVHGMGSPPGPLSEVSFGGEAPMKAASAHAETVGRELGDLQLRLDANDGKLKSLQEEVRTKLALAKAEGQGAQTQLNDFAARLGSFEQILSTMQEAPAASFADIDALRLEFADKFDKGPGIDETSEVQTLTSKMAEEMKEVKEEVQELSEKVDLTLDDLKEGLVATKNTVEAAMAPIKQELKDLRLRLPDADAEASAEQAILEKLEEVDTKIKGFQTELQASKPAPNDDLAELQSAIKRLQDAAPEAAMATIKQEIKDLRLRLPDADAEASAEQVDTKIKGFQKELQASKGAAPDVVASEKMKEIEESIANLETKLTAPKNSKADAEKAEDHFQDLRQTLEDLRKSSEVEVLECKEQLKLLEQKIVEGGPADAEDLKVRSQVQQQVQDLGLQLSKEVANLAEQQRDIIETRTSLEDLTKQFDDNLLKETNKLRNELGGLVSSTASAASNTKEELQSMRQDVTKLVERITSTESVSSEIKKDLEDLLGPRNKIGISTAGAGPESPLDEVRGRLDILSEQVAELQSKQESGFGQPTVTVVNSGHGRHDTASADGSLNFSLTEQTERPGAPDGSLNFSLTETIAKELPSALERRAPKLYINAEADSDADADILSASDSPASAAGKIAQAGFSSQKEAEDDVPSPSADSPNSKKKDASSSQVSASFNEMSVMADYSVELSTELDEKCDFVEAVRPVRRGMAVSSPIQEGEEEADPKEEPSQVEAKVPGVPGTDALDTLLKPKERLAPLGAPLAPLGAPLAPLAPLGGDALDSLMGPKATLLPRKLDALDPSVAKTEVKVEEKEKEPKEEQKEQKLEQKEKEEEKDDEDYDDNSFDDNMSVPESIQEESDLGSDTRRTEDSV